MLKSVLNFLFPQKCLGCGKEKEVLCFECLDKIDRADLPEQKNIFAAANYHDATLKNAIWLLKYKGVKQLAKPLAELIRRRLIGKIQIKDPIIIPIPISKKRLRQRGFNQAEMIAECLFGKTANDILAKKIHTESQVTVKDKEKRLQNLKGSFEVKKPELLKDRNVILVDDVCTTGATISEAVQTLKEAGAKKIIALVTARG